MFLNDNALYKFTFTFTHTVTGTLEIFKKKLRNPSLHPPRKERASTIQPTEPLL